MADGIEHEGLHLAPDQEAETSEPHFVIFRLWGEFVVRFRWYIVAFWIVATVLAVALLPSLSSVTNSNNSAFLPKNTPSLKAAALAAPFQQGTQPTSLIVASRATGPLTTADQAAITRAEVLVRHIPNVLGVQDQGVSHDRQARNALVILSSATGFGGSPETKSVIDGIRAAFLKVHAPTGLTMLLTGEIATFYDQTQKSQQTQTTTELLSVVFIVVLLLLVYRSLLAPILTLLPAGLALTISQPIIAQAHDTFGVSVSPITTLLLTVLLLGAGTDYGLFLVFRVREEMRSGLDSRAAVVKGLARVGETITFSAGTVIGALLCLLLASFGFYSGLGPALAIGIAVMLLVGLSFPRHFWQSSDAPLSGRAA